MLNIEGLTAGYSAIPVLNGVSIKVEQGQFVAIVGPNGADVIYGGAGADADSVFTLSII